MDEEHYLKRELYNLIQVDPAIFDFLQAGSLDGIFYWDVSKPEHEWLSPAFKSAFGYEDHEVPNTSAWWQEDIFPEDLPVALDNFRKHCEDPDHPYDQTVRYRHRDGSTVWVRCRGLAIRDEEGNAIRLLGAHQNVTELMQVREELQLKNAQLEQYAYVASHDLRAPLRTIAGFVDVLALSLEERSLTEDEQQAMSEITGGVTRMNGLIAALLDYSRIGKNQKPPIPVPVADLVFAAKQALGSDLTESGVTVSESIPDEVTWLVDDVLMSAAIQNLIANSIKYRRPEVPLHISISAASSGDRGAELTVLDNGQGIDPTKLERATKMFQRLTVEGEGLGIGLANVKRSVEYSHGTLTIDSDGSTFTKVTIWIPSVER